jgi:hypothetical protein
MLHFLKISIPEYAPAFCLWAQKNSGGTVSLSAETILVFASDNSNKLPTCREKAAVIE